MSELALGLGTIALVLILLAMRVPVGVALTLPSILGLSIIVGNLQAGVAQAVSTYFGIFSRPAFAIIPLYVLLGTLAQRTGLSEAAFDAVNSWLGHLRGGVAMATGIGAGFFAAITGSSVATVATMAKTALPEMRRLGYSDRLSAGVIAGSGSVGILIPPSVILVLYGILAEQSIGRLLLAGIVPGVLSVVMNVLSVVFVVRRNPGLAPETNELDLRRSVRALPGIVPVALVFLVVVGLFLFGILQPTEAAAAGVIAVLVIALVQRQFSLERIASGFRDAIGLSTGIVFLLGGAFLFSRLLARSGITRTVIEVAGQRTNPYAVLFGCLLVLLFLGMFLEGNAILALTVPVMVPLVLAQGFDAIWFGIVMVKAMEIAMYSPPVGLNIFTLVAAEPSIPVSTAFRGVIPFAMADVVTLVLIIVFPAIVLSVPNAVFN